MERLTRPWSARTLRLTMFLQSATEAISPETWARATGETPTIDQNLPRQLTRLEGGPIGPGFLTLQVQGMARRLDWTMLPPSTDANEVAPPTEFGPVEAALLVFNNVVRNWLAGTDIASNRLAVGVVAVIPMPDRVTAYKALQEYLPSVRIDAEHSRDLTYGINHPKLSRSLGPEVELNRITRWGALQQTVFVSTGVTVPGLGGLYMSVECDHSTPTERQSPLDNSKFVDIYDELMDMALENLERGELP
jgi:hypothetical protein